MSTILEPVTVTLDYSHGADSSGSGVIDPETGGIEGVDQTVLEDVTSILERNESRLYKEITGKGVLITDTVNNLGRLMSDRMQNGMFAISQSPNIPTGSRVGIARKWGDRDGNTFMRYTPISVTTSDLLKRLGTPNINSGDDGSWGVDDNDDLDDGNVSIYGHVSDAEGFNFHPNVVTPGSSPSTKRKRRDDGNEIGASLVVNPPHQFNPNDDVRSNPMRPHFGRVFSERIANSDWPVVIMEVGTIKYRKSMLSGTFMSGESDTRLLDRIRNGHGGASLLRLGKTLASWGLRATWAIATAPLQLAKWTWGAIFGVQKMAEFIPDTGLFAKYFDSVAQEIAAMLGLLQPYDKDFQPIAENTDTAPLSDQERTDRILSGGTENELSDDWRTLANSDADEAYGTDNADSGWWGDGGWFGGAMDDMTPGGAYAGIRRRLNFFTYLPWGSPFDRNANFIPFLVNSDIQVQEGISNSMGPNPVAENYNNASAEKAGQASLGFAERFFKPGESLLSNIMNIGSSAMEALDSVVESVSGALGARGEMGTVINGDARVILPDIWTNSSFDKSVSFDLEFNSPYGNKLSKFENTLLPFLLLFCMASPRQTGSRTYTNPFFIRANMRGFFSIPMGIIESLSITRGGSSNDWQDGLPRTIKVSVQLKDLTPVMMMGMNKAKLVGFTVTNDSYMQYLNTLGGLTIHDQLAVASRFSRWWKRVTQAGRGQGGGALGFIGGMIRGPFEDVYQYGRGWGLGRMAVQIRQAFGGPEGAVQNLGGMGGSNTTQR